MHGPRVAGLAATTISLGLIAVLGQPAWAQDDDDEDWFGPNQGDFELGVSGSVSRMFQSEVTAFDVGIVFGYFFTDWIEGGLGGSIGHRSNAGAVDPEGEVEQALGTPPVGGLRQALISAPLLQPGADWYGSSSLFVRVFPFEFDATKDMLPYYLGPFADVDFGLVYAPDISPFIGFGVSAGLNVYLTDQIALQLRLGYRLIHAIDDAVKFDEDSSTDHALGSDWGLSFYFS